MQINTKKLKKILLANLPYLIFAYAGNKISYAYRIADGSGLQEKLMPFLNEIGTSFAQVLPSMNGIDILAGAAVAGIMKVVLYFKAKNKKKFRQGEEYGSARWGGEKDIEPYMDSRCFENNVLLTQTERLTMGKPSSPKYARNKNILVIGGSGSGKTRFFVKPNIMQMHSSYVVTDPKGTILVECGAMLKRGRVKKDENGKTIYQKNHKDKNGNPIPVYEPYHIKVFNTIDFAKSMHYNPFAYISEKNREKDILKFVEVLIKNTSGNSPQSGEDFWVKAEKLLYTAYIAMIFTLSPESERNFETLIDMINLSECREEDETFKNAVDVQFECVEAWLNGDTLPAQSETNAYDFMQEYEPTAEQKRIGAFAIKQFKAYKLAAGDICSK